MTLSVVFGNHSDLAIIGALPVFVSIRDMLLSPESDPRAEPMTHPHLTIDEG